MIARKATIRIAKVMKFIFDRWYYSMLDIRKNMHIRLRQAGLLDEDGEFIPEWIARYNENEINHILSKIVEESHAYFGNPPKAALKLFHRHIFEHIMAVIPFPEIKIINLTCDHLHL
jgi:hypothetical protein